jgi:hypothetical protein
MPKGRCPPSVVAVPAVYRTVLDQYVASERTVAAIVAKRLKLDAIFTEALVERLKEATDGALSDMPK